MESLLLSYLLNLWIQLFPAIPNGSIYPRPSLWPTSSSWPESCSTLPYQSMSCSCWLSLSLEVWTSGFRAVLWLWKRCCWGPFQQSSLEAAAEKWYLRRAQSLLLKVLAPNVSVACAVVCARSSSSLSSPRLRISFPIPLAGLLVEVVWLTLIGL